MSGPQGFRVVYRRQFGDMLGLWLEEKGRVSFTLVPAVLEGRIPRHRVDINGRRSVQGMLKQRRGAVFPAYTLCSALQYKLSGDSPCPGYSAGETMLDSSGTGGLGSAEFRETASGVVLSMRDQRGIFLAQSYDWHVGDGFLRVRTRLVNEGPSAVRLEFLPAFTLGMLSLFQEGEGSESLQLCRWRSNWSNEGRLEQRPLEELGLEPSWLHHGVRSLRYGQRSSMPVKGFFPQIGLCDLEHGVAWGAVLEAPSSWQLEVMRSGDFCALSGGWVDREFGGWWKSLSPGEGLSTQEAAVTCVCGGVEELQNRLCGYGQGELEPPAAESELPVMFNDWCTTWGSPYPERLLPIACRLEGRQVRYFTLDDGWFKHYEDPDWHNGIGDWRVSPAYGEGGFRRLMFALRERGFIPGVWFEFENILEDTELFARHPEWLLRLDGQLLTAEQRHFLDFRLPAAQDYLAGRVIDFLRENGIGYMKVDYNAPIGFGCDGAESPSEGLRQHTDAVLDFYRRIRRELPQLVLEVCASGGHRLSPAWMQLAAMGSFSDAHEGEEIPLIAANTANLIPVAKNQIWAVLHREDTERRLRYSLASGILGRLCLSGEIAGLSEEQLALVEEAISFQRQAVPVLRRGENHLRREIGLSYVHPRGWQALVRAQERLALVVVHTFREAPEAVEIPLDGDWRIKASFVPAELDCSLQAGRLSLRHPGDFLGLALLLER